VSADRDQLKRAAALRAIEEIDDGMVVGLGTGSTAAFVVEGLAARVRPHRRIGSASRLRHSPSASAWT